jgi:hypothetical protein
MTTVMEIRFRNMGAMPPDFGITANLYWPSKLVPDDPGFALLTDDPWYRCGNNRGAYTKYYKDPPLPQFTNGKQNRPTYGFKQPPNNNNRRPPDSDSDTDMPDPSDDEDEDPSFPGGRRSLDDLVNLKRSPNELVINEGNTTRLPTEEELFEDFGLLKCEDRHCLKEVEELGYASLPIVHETPTSPATVKAVATASTTSGSSEVTQSRAATSLSYALEISTEVANAVKSIVTPAPRLPPCSRLHFGFVRA